MSESWIATLHHCVARHGQTVRVTVIAAEGSTPREVGAAMLVGRDLAHGTIGGGALELMAIQHARALLARDDDSSLWWREVRAVPLGPALGQCCGGYARLLFEVYGALELPCLAELARNAAPRGVVLRRLDGGQPLAACANRKLGADHPIRVVHVLRELLSGARPFEPRLVEGRRSEPDWFIEPLVRQTFPLYLYGAGHVGRAVVRVLDGLPFEVVWVDTAASRFPDGAPACVRTLVSTDPAAVAQGAAPAAYHLVMTYSHPLDLGICHAVLRRGEFGYLGLIGSASKRARFVKRLAEAGVSRPMLDRLVCPIGVAGISGKEPAMIAISTAAELIRLIGGAAARQSVQAAAERAG